MNGRLNEKKKLMVHVYDKDMELTVSKEEEQCYIMAAKYVNKKNNAYSDYYYLHQSETEILNMVMLDIAVNLMKHKCAERTSLLRRFINLFKKH